MQSFALLLLILTCLTAQKEDKGMSSALQEKGDNSSQSFDQEGAQKMSGVSFHSKESECMADTLCELRSQATAANIYLQEIKNTLVSFNGRLIGLEDKLNDLEKAIGTVRDEVHMNGKFVNEQLDGLEGRLSKIEEATDIVKEKIDLNGGKISIVQDRQKAMLSEVRLISLYKMTNATSDLTSAGGGGGHSSDLAVDGQYVFAEYDPYTSTRTFTHTEAGNQKLWIDLGALFRIHRVKVFNARHTTISLGRFVGTHIYADERLLGVATSAEMIYDFKVSEKDPVYAKSIILHQVLDEFLKVLEVQVWGTGPFPENDIFC